MRALTIVLVAGLVSATAFISPVAAQNFSADAVYQLQQLQEEVRQLRGLVEEQQRELERLRQRQRDQYLDLDSRIQALVAGANQPTPGTDNHSLTTLPGTGGGSSPAVLPTGPRDQGASAQDGQTRGDPTRGDAGRNNDTAQQPAVQPPREVPEVRGEINTRAAIDTIAEPHVRSTGQSSVGAGEQAMYDAAFAELKALRYERAADGFREFISAHPGSRLADNAQYWLGEAYYGARNFTMALQAFQRLLEMYPDSGKRPDALLKVGYSHYELRQWPAARAALEQVQAEYPDTTIARLAENRLRTMRLEGHF